MRHKPQTVWGEGLSSLITSQHNLRTRIEGRETGAQKVGWKPWKIDPEPSREDILDEFADVTAYFGTLAGIVMSRTGCSIQDLETAYMVKHARNWERFSGSVSGYAPQIPQSESQTLFRSREYDEDDR
jgi:hypothetical protein